MDWSLLPIGWGTSTASMRRPASATGHTTPGAQFGDPLIADGKVYVANESVVTILELSKTRKVIAKHEMNDVVVAPPVFANSILYVLTERRLYAIGAPK